MVLVKEAPDWYSCVSPRAGTGERSGGSFARSRVDPLTIASKNAGEL
jgi:hypothetical protein